MSRSPSLSSKRLSPLPHNPSPTATDSADIVKIGSLKRSKSRSPSPPPLDIPARASLLSDHARFSHSIFRRPTPKVPPSKFRLSPPSSGLSSLQPPTSSVTGHLPDPFLSNPTSNQPHGTTSNKFMEKLLQHTIIGAEFDSSARYPPPRCHPNTRLAIIERCKDFIVGRYDNEGKLHWIVGSAGVGKSAVMQTVAEETPVNVTLGASVFFVADKCHDETRIFTTIAYQLAIKSELYRQFIRDEITRDPSLLHKSLPVQFNQFIVEPFAHQSLFNSPSRFLIIIDGLDHCDDPLKQRALLRLISDFCMAYPTSPIVWMVSSRPEPHITSFFDEARMTQAYTKEEMTVDSRESRKDVRQYLHIELGSIKLAYPSLKRKRQWPSELDFDKIAAAAGGLFAYASTVVRYIGDPRYRGPSSRFNQVLMAIDTDPEKDISGKDHPLAQLDALYEGILSKIPADVLIDAKRLLLLYLGKRGPFRLQCNFLGLTEDAAYTAMGYIHSVVKVPEPVDADDNPLRFFHPSFRYYLCNFKRSGFSRNVIDDIQQLFAQCSMRIVEEVSDVVANGEAMKYDGISLSWPSDDWFKTHDDELRLELYQNAIATIRPTTTSWTILSRVPDAVMISARKLLLLRLYGSWSGRPFRMQCNLLGLTEDAAYGALRHLGSIVRVPDADKADDEPLKLFQQSFEEHLKKPEQPGYGTSDDVQVEIEQLEAQALLRIVEEVPVDSDGVGGAEVIKYEDVGYLKGGPGIYNHVSLAWPSGDRFKMTDDELRLSLYSNAIGTISFGFQADAGAFVNIPCFHVLTNRFIIPGIDFPFYRIQEFVFDKCRNELTEGGILKQVELRTLDFAAICGPITLHFASSTVVDSSGLWNSSCMHKKVATIRGGSTSFGRYEEDDWPEDDDVSSGEECGVGQNSDTELPRFNSRAGNEFHWGVLGEECLWESKQCNHCLRRLARYFMANADRLVTVFVDSTELCYVELSFNNPGDGGALWKYRFFHSGSPKM